MPSNNNRGTDRYKLPWLSAMILSDSAGFPSSVSIRVDISPNSSIMTCSLRVSLISFSRVPSHLCFSSASCSYGVAGDELLPLLVADDDVAGSSDKSSSSWTSLIGGPRS